MRRKYFSFCVFLVSILSANLSFATVSSALAPGSPTCRTFINMLSKLSGQISQMQLQLNSLHFRAFIWISLVLSAIAALFLLIVGLILGTYVIRKQKK